MDEGFEPEELEVGDVWKGKPEYIKHIHIIKEPIVVGRATITTVRINNNFGEIEIIPNRNLGISSLNDNHIYSGNIKYMKSFKMGVIFDE